MGKRTKNRRSTTNGKSKKVCNDSDSDKNDIDTRMDDDDDEEWHEPETIEPQLESSSDSDDETLVNIVEPSRVSISKARPAKKSSSNKPAVTDELIREKELEVESITSHKIIVGGKRYCLKWKDATKGETWVTRTEALKHYPNHLRNYDALVKAANEVEAILECRVRFGQQTYHLKWKDATRGTTWKSLWKTQSICPDILRQFRENEKNEIEAIVSHKRRDGCSRYLVKWKDPSKGETWMSRRKLDKFAPKLKAIYKKEKQKEELAKPKDEVEAILSHKRDHGNLKYLIKWKDHSKDETWMRKEQLLRICPQFVSDYNDKLQKAFLKENEVEAIVEHKRSHGRSKYLIKWKDHAKGETWETAYKVMSVAKDVLDKFVEENPDCAPADPPANRRAKRRANRKANKPDRWEDSDTDQESQYIKVSGYHYESDDDDEESDDDDEESDDDNEESDDDDGSDGDENAEWEVERILGVKMVSGKSREFLIRWKGYQAKHDSWEPEDQLNCPELIEKFTGQADTKVKKPSQKRLPPSPKKTKRRALKPKTTTGRSAKRSGRQSKK